MDAVVRKINQAEVGEWLRSVRVPFLEAETDETAAEVERMTPRIEYDRAWAVEDRGRFVGNCGIRTMDLTLPAAPGRPCPVRPMGGVTAVGVHPTHRRQGLLSRMMAEMLDDARSRQEPVAGLIASESVIYGRFGFGLATETAEYEIDSARAAFSVPVQDVGLRLITKDEAVKVLPDLFDRARPARAGEPNRTVHFWDDIFRDRPGDRHGSSALFFVACDEGYAGYRAREDGDVMRAGRVSIVVEEIQATSAEVEAALWRFVLDLDLIGNVTLRRRPVDEQIRWRLADPRQLRTQAVDDRLYVRILDVPGALEGRGYRSAGRLVLDVLDAAVGGPSDAATGAWVLEAGPDGATCRRASPGESPDLRLRVTELGSLYLGGFRASVLARAGLIDELTAGSLDAADALFAARPTPATVTGF